jgi:hypothetical protein
MPPARAASLKARQCVEPDPRTQQGDKPSVDFTGYWHIGTE